MLFRILLSFALLFAPVVAQQDAPYEHLKDGDYGPAYLTTTPTDLVSRTAFLIEVEITNSSSSSATVDILDKQGTPIPFLSGTTLAAKTTYVAKLAGRRMSNGITASASANSAIAVWMRFKW